MLDDIATLTGGQALMEDLGIKLDAVTLNELGQVSKVIIDKDNTILIEGKGKTSDIKARISQIKNEIDSTSSDYDCEKLQERLAKLSGGVAKINVGAATESEMKEKKARVEDALHATRAAVEEGILPGGGVALLRARKAITKLGLTGDEKVGANIIYSAITAPLANIAENAGFDGAVVVNKVEAGKDGFGFNAATGKYEDLVKAGVIDPKKVTRSSLVNASSIATLLLSTDAIIGIVKEDAPAMPAGAGGGMGGMPGMGGMGGMPGMM
jgi:chaperonin GroEL